MLKEKECIKYCLKSRDAKKAQGMLQKGYLKEFKAVLKRIEIQQTQKRKFKNGEERTIIIDSSDSKSRK